MSVKFSIFIVLVISLLAAPLAQRVTAEPAAVKMPGCAMMNCMNGCCAMMPCCAKSHREQPQPIQAPVPPRTDAQFAAVGLHVVSLVYELPAPMHTFVILDEATVGHAMPPLAVNCIQLI